jgi:site-specific DNA recombinase
MVSVQVRAALYARVSSEKQAKENTIASQLAELRERVAADGLPLLQEHCFIDDGHSGSTLVRPALERLRDAVYAGQLDRLYVHAPDRLARNYAYQFLLLEELQQRGVAVVFLNQSLGNTPEERMLVQMQGIVAEFERAKILERGRRGRRHAAQQGRVSVLTQAPFGYRYHSKRINGEARFEVVAEQAEVVRQIFDWVGRERVTLSEVRRRLHQRGVSSPGGQKHWSPSTLASLLGNNAYRGQALFHSGACRNDAPAEVIAIPVPVLINDALFTTVQEQLQENRRRQRQQRRGEVHLLQGLVVCQSCGRAFVHSKCRSSRYPRVYCYYRCTSMLAEGRRERTCTNSGIPASALEETVWQDVSAVLREPRRLALEYQRRLTQTPPQAESLHWLQQQHTKEQRALSRLIDAYQSGLLAKEEFAPRVERVRQRLHDWQTQLDQLHETQAQEQAIEDALGRLEDFAARIETGLREPTQQQRREILKALVKRVEIAPDKIRVIYKIHPLPAEPVKVGCLQDCPTGGAAARETNVRKANGRKGLRSENSFHGEFLVAQRKTASG